MKRFIVILGVTIALLFPSIEVRSAIFGKSLSLRELSDKSSLIIVGTIIKLESSWNSERTKIFTFIEIEVEEYIKGSGDKKITIRIPGGTAEGITEVHSGMPTFSEGEKVVLFLDPGRPYSDIVGAYQGKYTIIDDRLLEKGISASEFIQQIKILTGKEPPNSKILNVPRKNSTNPVKVTLDIPVPKEVKPIEFQVSQTGSVNSGAVYSLVMSENFEGVFPSSGWRVLGDGGVYWGVTDNAHYSGSKSAWCARSGPGGVDPHYYYYPNNVNSWMIYGPFSLSNIQSAFLGFYYWNRSESNHDYFKWGASIDGNTFSLYSTSGDSGGWQQATLDLKNSCGYPQVWIAFVFQSDGSNVDLGAYVDDISLSVSVPPVITSVTPSSASAGTNSVVTIDGNNFGTVQGTVYFRATGSNMVEESKKNLSLPANIVSWSDTQIKCYVPINMTTYPYSAGSFTDSIYVVSNGISNGIWSDGYPFNVTFGYSGHKWSADAIYYYINENTNGCVGEGAAIQAAANTWNGYSNFGLYYEGITTSTDYGQNGKNEVLWVNYETDSLAEAPCWRDSSSGNILECDIVFNDKDYSWSTSSNPSNGQYDIQTVALHEFGHWLFLLDLYGDNDTEKVMYGITDSGILKRSLSPDDIAGIQYIYGIPYTVTTIPPGLQITVDGSVYTAPHTFGWPPGSNHTISVSSPQGGASGTRYLFSSWSDGGDQSHQIIAPSYSMAYTATFSTTQYSLTVSVNPPEGGTVNLAATNWYNDGTYIYYPNILATANPGYSFSNWSGDLSDTNNPASISMTMNGPKSITANFTQNQYTLTVNINPSGWGSVTKDPDKPTYVYGEQLTLAATANTGYNFSNWSGDANGSVNPIPLTIDGNKTVTANFIQANGPDLTGQWKTPLSQIQTCKKTSKGLKCAIKCTFTVSNIWNQDAPYAYIVFYLSDNDTYNEEDRWLNEVLIGKVKAGKNKDIKLNYNKFSVGESASGKYIIVVIKGPNSETRVDNNIIVSEPIP